MSLLIRTKVIPISKSISRDFDNCASYYDRLELDQDFLYVAGIASEEELNKLGIITDEICYWCSVNGHLGRSDLYLERDLRLA